jgi:membrane protein implicated in regulation of membrane protease activity
MFVVVGLVGALLLVVFLLVDDALDAIIPDLDWISGPAIGAFLAAFGLFGWVATESFDASTPAAAAIGVAGGVGLGWFAYKLARVLHDGPTDPTPNASMLLGKEGRVVTPVRAGGSGEVLVRLAGQPVKLTATSDDDLPVGTVTVVVEVTSATKVVVQSADRFWTS